MEQVGWGKLGSPSARPALPLPPVLSGGMVGSPRTVPSCLGDDGSEAVDPYGRSGPHSPGCIAAWGLLGSPQHSTSLSPSNLRSGPASHLSVQTAGAHRAQFKQFSPILSTTHQHQGMKVRGSGGRE